MPTTGIDTIGGQASSSVMLPDSPAAHDVILRLRSVTKVYPGTTACDAVDLELRAGTVHALIGENGAGKSTLQKMITGAELPTAGTVEIDGRAVHLHHPHMARELGIVAVHQELSILPALTAIANVFLGQEARRGRILLDRGAMVRQYQALCDQLGVDIPAGALAGGLSIADQQSLEVMRALHAEARILVLDEPTASLAPSERKALYGTIRQLRRRGVAILLISHDLDEVLALSDVISVMRNGRNVATAPITEWTKERMVTAMLGGELRVRDRSGPRLRRSEVTVLRAENVRVPGRVHGIHLNLHRGEIVGIAGLVGAGRTELLRAISGLEPSSTGRLWIDERPARWPRSPRAAQRLGIALAPEDRKIQGLVQTLPAYANVTLTAPGRAAVGPILPPRRDVAAAWEVVKHFGMPCDKLQALTSSLSGGNQQKLLLAKWVALRMPVLLVDEPTRGIDVGAKAEVFAKLHDLADKGVAIALVSSELEEVVEHSDRIVTLARGRVVAELQDRGVTVADLLQEIFAIEEGGL